MSPQNHKSHLKWSFTGYHSYLGELIASKWSQP